MAGTNRKGAGNNFLFPMITSYASKPTKAVSKNLG